MEIWQIVPLVYAAIGAGIFVFILLKPRFFWTFLIVSIVGTAGLVMIPRSPYCVAIVDELFVGAISAGALLAMITGAVKMVKKPAAPLARIHTALFFALAGYMLFQSIRGLILWQEPLLLRWVFFYLLTIVLVFLTSFTDLPPLKKPVLIRTILWSAFVYLAVYLLHGFFIKYVLGISQFSLTVQGVQWTGPSYALFLAVVAVPAALLRLRHGPLMRQRLAWAVIGLTLLAGHFYDSRAVFVVVAIFFVISPTFLRIRKIVLVATVGLFAVLFFYGATLADFLGSIGETFTFSNPADTGRLSIVRASVDAIGQNADTLLFGYGINTHHYVLGPFMEAAGHPTIRSSPDYSVVLLPGQAFVYNSIGELPAYVRVTGFGSLLTDIGLVGALLLFAVFFILALRLLLVKNARARYLMLASLVLVFCWMFFSKVEDILLLWFMLMPSGILMLLVQDENAGRSKAV